MNKSMVNLLLNDDQTMPTLSAMECDEHLGLLGMIAMEVARNNNHIYTRRNYWEAA